MNTITATDPSKLLRVLRMMAWIGLVLFAIGAPISISLEEIGASISIISFIVLLILGDIRLGRSGIDVPILLLLLGTVSSSIITSPDKLSSLFTNVHHYWAILFFYFIISGVTKDRYRRSLFILLAVSMIAVLYGFFQSLTGLDPILHHHLNYEGHFYQALGFTGMHLTFGGIMSMISVVFFGIFLKAEDKKQKWTFFGGTALTAIITLLSFSRSAMVGLIAGYLFFFIVLSLVDRRKLLFLLAFIVLCGGMILSVPDFRHKMSQVVSVDYLKNDYRYQIWMTGINVVKANPIFGVGAGNFLHLYDKYKDPSFNRNAMGHAHNDMIETWVEGGIVGFAGYMLIFIMLVVQGLRKYFKYGNDPMVLALTVSAVVMFIQGLSQCYFITAINSWLFWYMAAGLSLYFRKDDIPLAA